MTVLFPWGTLLRAAAQPADGFAAAVRATLAPQGSLTIVTAIDSRTDASELARLGLGGFAAEQIAARWAALGFGAALRPLEDAHPYQTTWWRRLRHGNTRQAFELRLRPE